MEVCILGAADALWLLQANAEAYQDGADRARALRTGMLEIQSRLANNDAMISVALSSKWLRGDDLSGYVHALRNVLQNLSISGRHQQVIDLGTDDHALLHTLPKPVHASGDHFIHRAQNALLNGNESEWLKAMEGVNKQNPPDSAVITYLLHLLIKTNDVLGLPDIEDIPLLLSPAGGYTRLQEAGVSLCQKRKADSGNAISDVITRVHESIEKNLDNPTLSVASIAIETHYNPSYLSRLYKRQTGVNLTETIIDVRIRRACALLQDPAVKISDISRRVGYASPSAFAFFFRKRMGMTPKEYRMERC